MGGASLQQHRLGRCRNGSIPPLLILSLLLLLHLLLPSLYPRFSFSHKGLCCAPSVERTFVGDIRYYVYCVCTVHQGTTGENKVCPLPVCRNCRDCRGTQLWHRSTIITSSPVEIIIINLQIVQLLTISWLLGAVIVVIAIYNKELNAKQLL